METGVHKDYVECLLCGHKGTSLGGHLRYKHKITAREYKDNFGLCHSQPLECENLTQRRREAVEENPQVIDNLLEGGVETRFKEGCEGNTSMPEQRLEILRELSKKKSKLKDNK